MNRPLIITDCDEVLLHMVVPFGEWLSEEHAMDFDLKGANFAEAVRHKHDGTVVEGERIWELLNGFFDREMDRQEPIEGAVSALDRLSSLADIVILTNLLDHRREQRAEQLAHHGIRFPVYTNQGGKGPPISKIIEEHRPSLTVFVDDLANHHLSAKEHAAETWRLHMVGEPTLAPHIKPAPDAHARIDQWSEAVGWIEQRIEQAQKAPIS